MERTGAKRLKWMDDDDIRLMRMCCPSPGIRCACLVESKGLRASPSTHPSVRPGDQNPEMSAMKMSTEVDERFVCVHSMHACMCVEK